MIGNILYVIGNGFDRHHGLKTDVEQNLKILLKNCGDIDTVRLMGHSMVEVDSEYMEMFEKELNPRVWYISQFEG